ncbi:MAG: hypothetical protein ACRDNO_16415 [Trebonia sp.]
MSITEVRKIADAVLYEGYILYPYRASAQKNRSRWQFGVLMPPAYAAADPSETSTMRAECVFEHRGQPSLEITARFLQVQRRRTDGAVEDASVPAVWDEAVEQEITETVPAQALFGGGAVARFSVPGGEDTEDMSGARVVWRRETLSGTIRVRATPLPGPWQAARLSVELTNESGAGSPASREEALPAALVAAHMIITVSGGAFLSMTDPPEWASPQVAACKNTGCWPVLAGPEGSHQVMLAAPIILPDHPQVASESPGELYDGTEIDEILTLRTLALSAEEKAEARATDPRAAALIDRVDAMDPQSIAQLHGTIRAMSPSQPQVPVTLVGEVEQVPWWDPGADASVSPGTDFVVIAGQRVAAGSRVILRPGRRRADAQDMFLAGRAALVEAVLLDVEDTAYLAVTLADDLAADLQSAHGRFLYFAPDEVEPNTVEPNTVEPDTEEGGRP